MSEPVLHFKVDSMQQFQHFSDAELIHAYQQGQEQAIDTLVYRHKDKVYTAIYMLVKDKYLAEDLFQEAFLKMIRTIKDGRYAEQGKFLPWAVRVAHNLCMDHFRKVRINMPITTEEGRNIMDVFGFATESAEDTVERRQTHESVRQLIDQLPEEQREVVILRMYGDVSFKEIADLTNVSINTALGRMRYGLINLRKMIADQELILR